MKRLRLYDCRLSRLPSVVGLCADDVNGVARYVNGAQQRLLYAKEAGNDGWWGTFAEVVFTLDPEDPYITLPRDIARIMYMNWCNEYVPVENQFCEYLTFGNGRMPKSFSSDSGLKSVYTRNNVVTFADLTAGRSIRVYYTEAQDVGKRVLIQGTDTSDAVIYTQDGADRCKGEFITLSNPFATSTYAYNTLTGIQKDVTAGVVRINDVDLATGEETLLLTMEPSEQTASYRRYYMGNLPNGCCTDNGTTTTVQAHALVKLELIPVQYDTDYCLIQNLEALIEESSSIRYSEVDSPSAKQMSQERHIQAIRLLNGELNHYLGSDQAAVSFRPFGSASLSRKKVGTLY